MIGIKSERAGGAESDTADRREHPRVLYKHVQRHFDVPIIIRGIRRRNGQGTARQPLALPQLHSVLYEPTSARTNV
jgi:hypothetical protein